MQVGYDCVKEQVAFFRKHFGRVESEWKEDKSRVTFADLAISESICAALGRAFPEDEVFSEESDPRSGPRELKARYAWILDPVDGTNNFAIGMPFCAISLGLLRDGMPVYGFIYDFGRDRIVQGGPGLGIIDGEDSVGLMPQIPLQEKSIVGISFPIRGEWRQRLDPIVSGLNVRSMGSGALTLTYVALGFIEGCIDFRCKSWDVAAAIALLMAAGGNLEYMKEPLFPLRVFDVRCERGPFFAGTKDFCKLCKKMTEGAEW